MSFDDEPPTKKLGRGASSHRETLDLALQRIRDRCQRVHELCMQTADGALSAHDRGEPHERSEQDDEYLRALYARLHGHDDPHGEDAPPDRVRIEPAADDEEMRELWYQLFGAGHAPSPPARTPAERFELLRRALEEIIGATATASLVRSAATRALGRAPELAELSIERRGVELGYTLPAAWTRNVEPVASLRELIRELSPLLIERTGMTVIHRLGVVAERGSGSFPRARRAPRTPCPDA